MITGRNIFGPLSIAFCLAGQESTSQLELGMQGEASAPVAAENKKHIGFMFVA